jgi:hypothetical protein
MGTFFLLIRNLLGVSRNRRSMALRVASVVLAVATIKSIIYLIENNPYMLFLIAAVVIALIAFSCRNVRLYTNRSGKLRIANWL